MSDGARHESRISRPLPGVVTAVARLDRRTKVPTSRISAGRGCRCKVAVLEPSTNRWIDRQSGGVDGEGEGDETTVEGAKGRHSPRRRRGG